MVVISLRLIIYQFNNLMRLNTLMHKHFGQWGATTVKKSFTTPISAFFLGIKLKIIFSFACGLHQYMKLVQLLHITYWITNGLRPYLPRYSISKGIRYFLTAKKSPHRKLFQAAFIQVFLLPSLTITLQRSNIIYTYQFSPISFSIFFISKTITTNFASFTNSVLLHTETKLRDALLCPCSARQTLRRKQQISSVTNVKSKTCLVQCCRSQQSIIARENTITWNTTKPPTWSLGNMTTL